MPPASQPLDIVPAPDACPTCGATRTVYHPARHPADAKYACLTTTRMLASGFHGDPDSNARATRTVAVYRQFVKGLGYSDPRTLDPML